MYLMLVTKHRYMGSFFYSAHTIKYTFCIHIPSRLCGMDVILDLLIYSNTLRLYTKYLMPKISKLIKESGYKIGWVNVSVN